MWYAYTYLCTWKDKWGYLETVIGNAGGIIQKQSYLICKIKKNVGKEEVLLQISDVP